MEIIVATSESFSSNLNNNVFKLKERLAQFRGGAGTENFQCRLDSCVNLIHHTV